MLYLLLSWVVCIPLGFLFGELTHGSHRPKGSATLVAKIAEVSHSTGLEIVLIPLAAIGFLWMLIGPFVLATGVIIWIIVAISDLPPDLVTQSDQESSNADDQSIGM